LSAALPSQAVTVWVFRFLARSLRRYISMVHYVHST